MDNDDRLMAGIAALAHLQSAALEVIAALRATLDVAEDLVRDPSFVSPANNLAGAVARVFEFVEPLISPHPTNPAGPTSRPASPDDGPVQHIRIS